MPKISPLPIMTLHRPRPTAVVHQQWRLLTQSTYTIT